MPNRGATQIAGIKSPPAWFRIAMALPSGRYHVLTRLRAIGKLDSIASFRFYDGRAAQHLIDYTAGWRCDLSAYQIRRVSRFAMMCDGFMGDFDLVDCGANVGLFAAQFARHSFGIRKLVAIEPNARLFPLMGANLRSVRAQELECRNAALASFHGRGRLVAPDYDANSDAMFLVNDESGDVDVITLSSVLRTRTQSNVAIKIDVEGQEGPVLSAATDDIRSLAKIALFVEIHRKVLARIGSSDVELMEGINGIRPFRWVRAFDGAPIKEGRSPLAQFGVNQCDAIGISID